MWLKITEFFSKVWSLLKKTPGAIILTLLALVAVVWWLVNRQLLLKKKLQIQKEITNIETDVATARASAEATHRLETAAATKEYEEEKAKLEEQKERIEEAERKGPVAIAEEWKRFLSGG